MNYDFSVLSDIEFEQMVNKLLADKARVVEQYAEGRDNGIDGLVREIPPGAHIHRRVVSRVFRKNSLFQHQI